MHILQEGNTVPRRDTSQQESTGCDLVTDCDVCGEKAIVNEPDGHHYCLKHHEDWCKCITHNKMVKAHGEKK
jgi:hypothetical protein